MSRSARTSRHRAREAALQVLYSFDLRTADATDLDGRVEDAFQAMAENFELQHSSIDFAKELVRGVSKGAEEIDLRISEAAVHWRITRMAVVDRNILRLAVFEMQNTKTPTAVIIDEAIELARRFGSDQSPKFINGVLDAVAQGVANVPGTESSEV